MGADDVNRTRFAPVAFRKLEAPRQVRAFGWIAVVGWAAKYARKRPPCGLGLHEPHCVESCGMKSGGDRWAERLSSSFVARQIPIEASQMGSLNVVVHS
jgi:hypothetical protein